MGAIVRRSVVFAVVFTAWCGLVGTPESRANAVGSTSVSSGRADEYSMKLTSQPTAPVRVSFVAPDALSISPQTIEFDAANWNVSQTVHVQLVGHTREQFLTIRHVVSSSDRFYDGLAVRDLRVRIAEPAGNAEPSNEPARGGAAEPIHGASPEPSGGDNVEEVIPHNPPLPAAFDALVVRPVNMSINGNAGVATLLIDVADSEGVASVAVALDGHSIRTIDGRGASQVSDDIAVEIPLTRATANSASVAVVQVVAIGSDGSEAELEYPLVVHVVDGAAVMSGAIATGVNVDGVVPLFAATDHPDATRIDHLVDGEVVQSDDVAASNGPGVSIRENGIDPAQLDQGAHTYELVLVAADGSELGRSPPITFTARAGPARAPG